MKDDLFELLSDKLRKAEHGTGPQNISSHSDKERGFYYSYRFGPYRIDLDGGLGKIPKSKRNCKMRVQKYTDNGYAIDDCNETYQGEEVNDLFYDLEEGREKYEERKAEEKRVLDARVESEKRQRKYEFKEELKDYLLNGD